MFHFKIVYIKVVVEKIFILGYILCVFIEIWVFLFSCLIVLI